MKIKEGFELVIEVCVFLRTIIKFVSRPDPVLSQEKGKTVRHTKSNFLGHAACTIKTSVT